MDKTLCLLIFCIFFLACGQNDSPQEAEKVVKETHENTKSRKEKGKSIVFFGNSLTAAYGLDPSQGFTYLLQQRLDSLGYKCQVINAGLSGETSAGGNRRIDWILRQHVDVFVLELGGNDGLRGIQPEETHKNLQGIIDKVKQQYPEAKLIIAGMEAPPNMGEDFTAAFRNIFPGLANDNNAALIPFLLEGVAGIPELNLPDGIHPSEEGQKIVAENVWKILEKVLDNK